METGTNAAEDAAEDVAEEQTEEPVEEQSGQPAEEQEEPAAEDEDEGGPAGTRNGSIESPADESISDGDMDEDIWEDAVQEEIPVPEELEQSEAMYSEADAAGGDSAEIGSWAELKQMINECEVGGTITSTKVNQGQGARIGGGCNAAPGKITIGGGNITTSGGSGAGIGGGKENKSGVSIRGISAMLESDNTLRLYLGFKDVEPSGLTYMIDGQSAELKTRSDGASYLALDAGVYSNHLQDTNLYSISDGTNTYTLTMSVLTYARSCAIKSKEEESNLGKALYLYNQAASAMFAN